MRNLLGTLSGICAILFFISFAGKGPSVASMILFIVGILLFIIGSKISKN